MKTLSNVLIMVGLMGLLYSAAGLAENFCCNPYTFECEDCAMCPNEVTTTTTSVTPDCVCNPAPCICECDCPDPCEPSRRDRRGN